MSLATIHNGKGKTMSETDQNSQQPLQQTDFEEITTLVYAEFQVEEALMEHNIPTYYLKQPQETKQPFLRLLKNLEKIGFIAFLRRKNGRVVLRVTPKPPTKPSNILINWLLFFATIGTTFLTGYMISSEPLNPLIGGITFTISIMAVLGIHEMGHKITANKRGIEATSPYFIPGPPPIGGILGIGTFGAVIMQKSLPPNKDALFDVGASGPVAGFFAAVIAATVGISFSHYTVISENAPTLPTPILFWLIGHWVSPSGPIPQPSPGEILAISLHPVAFAGWVGIIVTMLNLLPAAMLDGGHIARSLVGEKLRGILTALSIILLIIEGFWPMAFFVLFLSMYRHPGPLDDVSSLSKGRKIFTIVLLLIFVLCFFI
ncbi:site-2 protease family protein [Candidatus Bathyarchaeota archaeon]|nr:MAG: site-2 protease family protein [Candidatus Bathyarchaeota archaeon]